MLSQDALTFDETPTASSANPVKSGGVKAAIDTAVAGVNETIADVVDGTTPVAKATNADEATARRQAQDCSRNLYQRRCNRYG